MECTVLSCSARRSSRKSPLTIGRVPLRPGAQIRSTYTEAPQTRREGHKRKRESPLGIRRRQRRRSRLGKCLARRRRADGRREARRDAQTRTTWTPAVSRSHAAFHSASNPIRPSPPPSLPPSSSFRRMDINPYPNALVSTQLSLPPPRLLYVLAV